MRLLLLLLALFTTAALAAAPSNVDYDMVVRGQVKIGPDGKVLSHELHSSASQGVAELIAKNAALWQFEPITRNGKPVIAQTAMTLSVGARETATGTFSLSVKDVWFGEPQAKPKQKQPRYPSTALRAHLGARVHLALELSPEGKVVAAHPYQTSLTRRMDDGREAKWRKRFEAASLAAAMHWSYQPQEYFDGAEAMRFVETTVVFLMQEDSRRKWHAFVPGPLSPPPFFDANALLAKQSKELPEGLTLPLSSPFKLISGAPESL